MNRDIVSKDKLQYLLQQSGINQGDTIIIYGDKNNWFAAWAAWVFDIYGIENVKLLDGGKNKWEAENRALPPLATKVESGNIQITKTNNNLRARLKDVVAVATKKSDFDLLDIRSAAEYSGKIFAPEGVPELSVRAGHILSLIHI